MFITARQQVPEHWCTKLICLIQQDNKCRSTDAPSWHMSITARQQVPEHWCTKLTYVYYSKTTSAGALVHQVDLCLLQQNNKCRSTDALHHERATNRSAHRQTRHPESTATVYCSTTVRSASLWATAALGTSADQTDVRTGRSTVAKTESATTGTGGGRPATTSASTATDSISR